MVADGRYSVAYTLFIWLCLNAAVELSTRYTTLDTTVEIGSTSASDCGIMFVILVLLQLNSVVSIILFIFRCYRRLVFNFSVFIYFFS